MQDPMISVSLLELGRKCNCRLIWIFYCALLVGWGRYAGLWLALNFSNVLAANRLEYLYLSTYCDQEPADSGTGRGKVPSGVVTLRIPVLQKPHASDH